MDSPMTVSVSVSPFNRRISVVEMEMEYILWVLINRWNLLCSVAIISKVTVF